MSVKSCLHAARTAGEISREEHEGLSKLFNAFVQQYGSFDAAKAAMVEPFPAHAGLNRRAT